MNIFKRFGKRLDIISHSQSVGEFFDNITDNTFDCIAAMPILFWLLHMVNVLGSAVYLKFRSLVLRHYYLDLKAMVPSILLCYVIMLVILIGKSIRSGKKFKDRLRDNPVYILFFIAMVWMLIAVIADGWTDITLLGDEFRCEGILSYWGYIAVLFFSGSLIRNDKVKRFLADVTLTLSLAVFVYALWHFYYYRPLIDISTNEDYPSAVFIHFNHYGYYLAVNIMLAAMLFVVTRSLKRKVFYLICFGANTVMLNLNTTFGAWLACAVGFVFAFIAFAIKDRRFNLKVLAAFVSFLALTVIMSLMGNGQLTYLFQFFSDVKEVTTDSSGAGNAGTARWALWKATVKFIKERPLFGFGIEGIDERLKAAAGAERTHNEYLQYAVTFGIPEAVAYTAACIGVFVRNLRRKKLLSGVTLACLTVAFTYLVSACFGVTLYNTAPYLFIFLGLGYRSVKAREMI
ncbi:MAG: O-antigen ligase family protein [Candidatus Weimeria sp.]